MVMCHAGPFRNETKILVESRIGSLRRFLDKYLGEKPGQVIAWTWHPMLLKSHFFQFTATNTSHKIIPFDVGKFDGVLVFANADVLICNLHGGATSTGGAENNLNCFHILHLLSK